MKFTERLSRQFGNSINDIVISDYSQQNERKNGKILWFVLLFTWFPLVVDVYEHKSVFGLFFSPRFNIII